MLATVADSLSHRWRQRRDPSVEFREARNLLAFQLGPDQGMPAVQKAVTVSYFTSKRRGPRARNLLSLTASRTAGRS